MLTQPQLLLGYIGGLYQICHKVTTEFHLFESFNSNFIPYLNFSFWERIIQPFHGAGTMIIENTKRDVPISTPLLAYRS